MIDYTMLEPPLYKHQIEAVDWMTQCRGGFIAYEMGLGKTRSVLEWFRIPQSKGYKLLVICPLTLINTAWKDDISKFTDFKMCDLHSKARFEADIYVINYDALLSSASRAELHDLCQKHKIIACLDESSRISNPRAKTTKYVLELRDQVHARVCLSGTPCSQSDTQWWSQVFFLDSQLLGSNYWSFENHFFQMQRGKQCLPMAGLPRDVRLNLFKKGWKLTLAKREELYKRLKKLVIWRKLDDCVDLPDVVDEVREFEMSKEQGKAYKEMRDELVTEIQGKQIVSQVALTRIMKLRTITSGFAYTPEGELARMDGNPKLNELEEVLNEIGNEQAIIWVNFKAEVADIKSILGETARYVDGDSIDKSSDISAFKDGTVRYLVANLQSMSHGVTLVNARYNVYYSHSYSAEHFAQSRARVRRIGQSKTCVYIHLCCKDSIDGIILDVLKKKRDAVEIVARILA